MIYRVAKRESMKTSTKVKIHNDAKLLAIIDSQSFGNI